MFVYVYSSGKTFSTYYTWFFSFVWRYTWNNTIQCLDFWLVVFVVVKDYSVLMLSMRTDTTELDTKTRYVKKYRI